MPLYEVTLRQRYYDQLCVNVFDYLSPGGLGNTPSSLELLTLMGFIPEGDPLAFPAGTIADALSDLQSSSVEFLSVEARELYSVTDFYEAAYSPVIAATGGLGNAMPPFNAYGLYTARIRTDIRRSFKRFVGVSEGYVDNGGVLTSTANGLVADLGELLSDTLSGATAVYSPATISREKVVDPDTDAVSYQLYATEAEQEEHTAYPLVWAGYTVVRSQTSRQYGRGQ